MAKRARKKSKLNAELNGHTKTQRKDSPKQLKVGQFTAPKFGRKQQSVAVHMIESNRKKAQKSRKKKKGRNKVDVSSLKKIDFKKKMTGRHKTVDSEKRIRIGY